MLAELGVSKDELKEKKAVEVGNIFPLGTRFSEPLGLNFTDESGQQQPVIMGCYGIGPGRVMGTIVEHFADERGLVWPANIAPYGVYICQIGDSDTIEKAVEQAYNSLSGQGISVLWDDRAERPGEQFADADLFGIPNRVVVSEKSLQAGGYELKKRTEDATKIVSLEQLNKLLGKSKQD